MAAVARGFSPGPGPMAVNSDLPHDYPLWNLQLRGAPNSVPRTQASQAGNHKALTRTLLTSQLVPRSLTRQSQEARLFIEHGVHLLDAHAVVHLQHKKH